MPRSCRFWPPLGLACAASVSCAMPWGSGFAAAAFAASARRRRRKFRPLQSAQARMLLHVLLLPYSPSCRLPLLGPLLLPRLALLLLLLQPSCFFSGSTVLRNTSSCFSVLVLCFSESSKQMRAANKSEKGSPLLPFALLDLPWPWQLLSLLPRWVPLRGRSTRGIPRPALASARVIWSSARRTRGAPSARPSTAAPFTGSSAAGCCSTTSAAAAFLGRPPLAPASRE